jgi:hypothetical protein
MGYLIQRDGQLAGGLHWNGQKWGTDIHGTPEEIKHESNFVTGDDFFMVSVGYWGYSHIYYAGLGEFDNRTKKWKGFRFQTEGELRAVWTDGKGFFIAGGDNGMMYIKDGYTAPWMYQQAPTDYSLAHIDGVSKQEIYIQSFKWISGTFYSKGYRLQNSHWTLLFDTKDTEKVPIILNYPNQEPLGICAYRCGRSLPYPMSVKPKKLPSFLISTSITLSAS